MLAVFNLIHGQCCRDDRISRCYKDHHMHQVKQNAIANGQPFVMIDIMNTLRRRVVVARQSIIQHREPVIITFHKKNYQWNDPAYYRDQGYDQQCHEVYRLPATIADCHPDAPCCFFADARPVADILIAFDDGFGFAAQVCKNGRTEDETDIFKEREIKEEQGEPEDNAGKCEQESKQTILKLLSPVAEMQDMGYVFDDLCSGFAEEIHAGDE